MEEVLSRFAGDMKPKEWHMVQSCDFEAPYKPFTLGSNSFHSHMKTLGFSSVVINTQP